MSHALVTGGTGFIGLHLVRALADRGDEVTCLVRLTSNQQRTGQLRAMGANLVEVESLDSAGLQCQAIPCDTVYYLAGATSARTKSEFLQINAHATSAFLAPLAARQSPPDVVLVSSLAAAGPAAPGGMQREEDAPRPVSWYGRSKLLAELLVRGFADKLPITIVRPPMVLGPGDTASVEMFRVLARMPLHPMPGLRLKKYSLVFVQALAKGLIQAAHSGERLPAAVADAHELQPGDIFHDRQGEQHLTRLAAGLTAGGRGIYYLASDQRLTYKQIGRFVATAVGRHRMLPLRTPNSIIWCIATWNELVARARRRATFFGWDKCREAITGDWTCSAAKAQTQLGFSADDDLATRFTETYEWYRDSGWL